MERICSHSFELRRYSPVGLIVKSFTVKGSFDRTLRFLERIHEQPYMSRVEALARAGVAALEASTPKDTGTTASSWYYRVIDSDSYLTIQWMNSSTNDGVNIAIILQYGHATGTGGYVAGIDYINPAVRPIMDSIDNEVWKAVTTS